MARNSGKSQTLFSPLYENMRDAFASVNMEGYILECNQEYRAMVGYDADELSRLTYRQLTPSKWHAFEEEILRTQVLVRGYSDLYEKEYQQKDGTIIPVELRTILVRDDLGQPTAMWAIVRDITKRKQAEQELKTREEMSRLILKSSSASILLMDEASIILSINEAGARRLNRSVSEMVGRVAYEFLPPDVAAERRRKMEEVFRTGKPVQFNDQRHGIWYESRVYPILDGNGQVTRLAVIANDVTDTMQMIEALQDSEERYRSLAETSRDCIFIIDREDTIQYVNTFAAQLLGMPNSEVIGQKRSVFFEGAPGRRQFKHILEAIQSGAPRIFDAPIRLNKKALWLSTQLVPLKNAAGEVNAVLGVARDITDRIHAEQALVRAQHELEGRVAKRTSELEATEAKLRSLATQILSAQEEERRRVSRELHDDASQMLVSLHYSLAALMEDGSGIEAGPARERLENVIQLVDSITEHLRTLGHSLRPPALDVGGLDISLKEFCREFAELTKINVEYHGESIHGLPQEVSISLYRFVQEALTNILKHAHANQVKVRLVYRNNEILLSISDNGKGFSGSGKSKGVGLLGIAERLNLVGGTLIIPPQRGKGASLVARIPWGPESHG